MPKCEVCNSFFSEWGPDGNLIEIDGMYVDEKFTCSSCMTGDPHITRLRTVIMNRERIKDIIDSTIRECIDDVVRNVPGIIALSDYESGHFSLTVDNINITFNLDEYIDKSEIDLFAPPDYFAIRGKLIGLITDNIAKKAR